MIAQSNNPDSANRSSTPTVDSYQRFPSQYFSGANVVMYFGKIWVDEIVTLSFGVQEKVEPIHGYASYTPDAFARGFRQISGNFSINFREKHYLTNILNTLERDSKSRTAEDPSVAYRNIPKKTRATLQEFLEQTENIDNNENLAEIIESYQSTFWGDPKQASSADDTYFYPSKGGENKNLRDNGVNIVVTYGNIGKNDSNIKNRSTTKSIMGVQLVGCTQSINPSGEPILEHYTFMAKDLDGFIK